MTWVYCIMTVSLTNIMLHHCCCCCCCCGAVVSLHQHTWAQWPARDSSNQSEHICCGRHSLVRTHIRRHLVCDSDSACEQFGRIENISSVVHRPLLVWAVCDVWWEAGDAPGLQMMLEWVCLIAETWHQAEAVGHLEKREAVSDIS